MGSVFSTELLGVADPRCGCSRSARSPRRAISSRSRPTRCSREAEGISFAGNAEGRDLLRGAADVVVTDGFTGNMALKLLEGGDRGAARPAPRGDRRDAARQARRPPDPPGRPPRARPARPGHLRRRLPARPARARRDRPRQLGPPRDRERDRARRARRRAPRRRAPRRAAARARACRAARCRTPGCV